MALHAESLILPPAALLDRVRAAALRLLAPRGRTFLRNRAARAALYGTLGVATAFALTLACPLPLLALGPIALGVPHLLSDVRYLVVRSGLHQRPGFWPLVASPLLATLVWPGAATALFALAGAAFLAKGSRHRRAAVLAVAVALSVPAFGAGGTADVIFAHAHNLFAIVLWIAWTRGPFGYRWVPLILFVLATGWLCFGSLGRVEPAAFGLAMPELLESLALPGPYGERFVLFFAFAQATHYAIWLRLVPEEDRTREGIRSFDATVRALAADIGWPTVAGFGTATALVMLGACVDVRVSRGVYLQLASFHGPLEFSVAALLFVESGARNELSSRVVPHRRAHRPRGIDEVRNYASGASSPKAAGERSRQRAAGARPPC